MNEDIRARYEAAQATRGPAFDHQALAAALGRATGKDAEADNLQIKNVSIELNPIRVLYDARGPQGKRWQFAAVEKTLSEIEAEQSRARNFC